MKSAPKFHTTRRLIAGVILVTFSMMTVFPPGRVYAQPLPFLPAPGTLVAPSQAFVPPMVRGIKLFPENPLQFGFIVDPGTKNPGDADLEKETMKMVKYFMSSLTTPEQDMWVNLSPYEKDRMIDDQLGETEMGRDLLAQDYILKQLTASLIYPENGIGKEFWGKIYKKVHEKFGTTDIPINTFNKVWIVADKAVVYEATDAAFVLESHLKVMLEEDYLALEIGTKSQNKNSPSLAARLPASQGGDKGEEISSVSSQIVREIIVPAIEKEVNEGEHFAMLRQIFNAHILATWYKRALKESLLGKVYVDKNKTAGVEQSDKNINNKIYDQYIESFKTGAFNIIREDYDEAVQDYVHRRYFSGGIVGRLDAGQILTTVSNRDLASLTPEQKNDLAELTDGPAFQFDIAMVADAQGDLSDSKSDTPKNTALLRLEQIKTYYQSSGISETPEVLLNQLETEFTHHNIPLDAISFAATKEDLVLIGPGREFESQYFRIILGKEGDSQLINSLGAIIRKIPQILMTPENLNGRVAFKILLPPNFVKEYRAILRIIKEAIVNKPTGEIVPGLTYEEQAVALTDEMVWDFFAAKTEAEFEAKFRKNLPASQQKYKEIFDFVDAIANNQEFPELELLPEKIREWDLERRIGKKAVDMAPNATAGIRALLNYLNAADLDYPQNILLQLFMINAMADKIIMMSQGEQVEAIISGETRAHSEVFIKAVSRLLAAKGIIVHNPKKGDYLPIGAHSFALTLNRMSMGVYFTASHSARGTGAGKLQGSLNARLIAFIKVALSGKMDVRSYEKPSSEGAQLLIEEMVEIAQTVNQQIANALKNNSSIKFKFAPADSPLILDNIDNPNHPKNIDVSGDYTKYIADSITPDRQKEIRLAFKRKMRLGYHQMSGAGYLFHTRVYTKLLGYEFLDKIDFQNIHPDSYYDGTGMTYYNAKRPRNPALEKFIADSTLALSRFFGDKAIGYKLEANYQGNKVYFEVYAEDAEHIILRNQGIPFINIGQGKLLAYYEPELSDLSQDVSLAEVVANSGIIAKMKSAPISFFEDTTDPDADRYVKMQVEENNDETRERLKRLGINYVVLSDRKLLVIYVPNQGFEMLIEFQIELLKEMGKFKQHLANFDEQKDVKFVLVSTTVSSTTWRNSATKNNMKFVLVPVGFKEGSEVERIIEEQLLANEARAEKKQPLAKVVIHDIFGNLIDLGYNPRIMWFGEESGGGVVATDKMLMSADEVRKFLVWREKSALEMNILDLLMSARIFNRAYDAVDGDKYTPEELYQLPEFQQRMSLSRYLDDIYTRNGSTNIEEQRVDLTLVEPMAKVGKSQEEQQAIDDRAIKQRDYNDTFFLSMAFAREDGDLPDIEVVKSILKDAFINDGELGIKLAAVAKVTKEKALEDLSRWIDDELIDIRFQGDGTCLFFKSGGYAVDRPSGTDTKLKGYPSTYLKHISKLLGYTLVYLNPAVHNFPTWKDVLTGKGRSDLLEVEKVMARKLVQNKRRIEVDHYRPWAHNDDIQVLLTKQFGQFADTGFSDVLIYLGPKTQKSKLEFIPAARVLYLSWDLDDEIQNASGQDKVKILQRAFSLMQTIDLANLDSSEETNHVPASSTTSDIGQIAHSVNPDASYRNSDFFNEPILSAFPGDRAELKTPNPALSILTFDPRQSNATLAEFSQNYPGDQVIPVVPFDPNKSPAVLKSEHKIPKLGVLVGRTEGEETPLWARIVYLIDSGADAVILDFNALAQMVEEGTTENPISNPRNIPIISRVNAEFAGRFAENFINNQILTGVEFHGQPMAMYDVISAMHAFKTQRQDFQVYYNGQEIPDYLWRAQRIVRDQLQLLIAELHANFNLTAEEALKLKNNDFWKINGFEGDKNRLGFLMPAVNYILGHPKEYEKDKSWVKKQLDAGMRYFVFVGQGGSSLTPEMISKMYNLPKGVKVFVLQSTDPRAMNEIFRSIMAEQDMTITKALELMQVIVISKSGTTVETRSHFDYLKGLFAQYSVPIPGHFLVLSDPGTEAHQNALTEDIPYLSIQYDEGNATGGRFSSPATRILGLIMALVDPDKYMSMLKLVKELNDLADINRYPFAMLAAYMYHFATQSNGQYSNFTFMAHPQIGGSLAWNGQLWNESIGKNGKGLPVIFGEDFNINDLRSRDQNDRIIVVVNFQGQSPNPQLVQQLKANGYPVFELNINSIDEIGALQFGLEMSVMALARMWGFNPVVQEAVEEYKRLQKLFLQMIIDGKPIELPQENFAQEEGIKVFHATAVATHNELRTELGRIQGSINNPVDVYAALTRIAKRKGTKVFALTVAGNMSDRFRGMMNKVRKVLYTARKIASFHILEITKDLHSTWQMLQAGASREHFFTTVVLPERMEQLENGSYPAELLRAQALAGTNALTDAGRFSVLVTVDGEIGKPETEQKVAAFFEAVDKKLQSYPLDEANLDKAASAKNRIVPINISRTDFTNSYLSMLETPAAIISNKIKDIRKKIPPTASVLISLSNDISRLDLMDMVRIIMKSSDSSDHIIFEVAAIDNAYSALNAGAKTVIIPEQYYMVDISGLINNANERGAKVVINYNWNQHTHDLDRYKEAGVHGVQFTSPGPSVEDITKVQTNNPNWIVISQVVNSPETGYASYAIHNLALDGALKEISKIDFGFIDRTDRRGDIGAVTPDNPKRHGGIDLKNTAIQIKRDGQGRPLPAPMQDWGQIEPAIKGFSPFLIQRTFLPTVIPLLGLKEEDEVQLLSQLN